MNKQEWDQFIKLYPKVRIINEYRIHNDRYCVGYVEDIAKTEKELQAHGYKKTKLENDTYWIHESYKEE